MVENIIVYISKSRLAFTCTTVIQSPIDHLSKDERLESLLF